MKIICKGIEKEQLINALVEATKPNSDCYICPFLFNGIDCAGLKCGKCAEEMIEWETID